MERTLIPAPAVSETRQQLRYLQNTQDNFARTTGMAICLLRPNGRPLTPTSGRTQLYNTLMNDAAAASLCRESFAKLHALARKTRKAQMCICEVTGLRIAVVPLLVDGDYYYWLTGQVREAVHLDHYDSFAIQLAHATGLSSKQLKIQYCSLPELSQAQFARNLRLLQAVGVPAAVPGGTSAERARPPA
ncbi:MAG: hypothetical protein GXY32_07860 [Ruminococcaceae bacterium]|nr:hypothetical protein [Oscillospiraceae bacterium]